MIKKMFISTFLIVTMGGSLIMILLFLSEASPPDKDFDKNLEEFRSEVSEFISNEPTVGDQIENGSIGSSQESDRVIKEVSNNEEESKEKVAEEPSSGGSDSQKEVSLDVEKEPEAEKKFNISRID